MIGNFQVNFCFIESIWFGIMKKFVVVIFCTVFLIYAYTASASLPVAVKITGCVEKDAFMSEETDFGTHKVIRTEKEARYKITPVDYNLKSVSLSSYEGKRIKASGRLLPGDQFIIERESIKELGLCLNKAASSGEKENPENRKLSLKEQEKLAQQLYETMAKTDKWDIEAFIKLHRQVIEKCPDTQKAQESIWRLSNLYLLSYDTPKYKEIIHLLETLISRYPNSPLIPDAKKRLLVSYKETGEIKKVVEMHEQAFTANTGMLEDPESAALIIEYAEALAKIGDTVKACEYYNKVIGFGDNIEDWMVDIAKDAISQLESGKCKIRQDEKKKMIGEEKAQELIWSLPEVKALSKRIKSKGKKPFTRIDARPEGASGNGNFYIVYFGEDHGARVVNVMTFYVNAYTERIYVYEPILDTRYPIEQWRMMQQ